VKVVIPCNQNVTICEFKLLYLSFSSLYIQTICEFQLFYYFFLFPSYYLWIDWIQDFSSYYIFSFFQTVCEFKLGYISSFLQTICEFKLFYYFLLFPNVFVLGLCLGYFLIVFVPVSWWQTLWVCFPLPLSSTGPSTLGGMMSSSIHRPSMHAASCTLATVTYVTTSAGGKRTVSDLVSVSV